MKNIQSQKRGVEAKKQELQPQVEKTTGSFRERIAEISKGVGGKAAGAAILTLAAAGAVAGYAPAMFPAMAAGLGVVAAGAAAYVGYKTLFSRTAEVVEAKPVEQTPPVVPAEKPPVPAFTKDVSETLNQTYDKNDVNGQVRIINSAWALFSRDPNRIYESMRKWMEEGKFTDQQHREAFVEGLVSCIHNVNDKTKDSLCFLIDEIIFNDNNLKKASIFQTFMDRVDGVSDDVKEFIDNRISYLMDFGKADGDEMQKFWYQQMKAFYTTFREDIDKLLPLGKGEEKKIPTPISETAPTAGTSAISSTTAPTITIPSTPTATSTTSTTTTTTTSTVTPVTMAKTTEVAVNVEKHREYLKNLANNFVKAKEDERIQILNQIWGMFDQEGVDEGKSDIYSQYDKIVTFLFNSKLSDSEYTVFINRFINCINKNIDNDRKKVWLQLMFGDIIWKASNQEEDDKQFIFELIMKNVGMNDIAKQFILDALPKLKNMPAGTWTAKFAQQYAKELGISSTTPTTTASTAKSVPSAGVDIEPLLNQMKSANAEQRFQALKGLSDSYTRVNIDNKVKIIQAIITMLNDDSKGNANSALALIVRIGYSKFSDAELQAIIDGCADFISNSGNIMQAIKNRSDLTFNEQTKLQLQKQHLIIELITILNGNFIKTHTNLFDRAVNVNKLDSALTALKKEIAGTAFDTDIINKNIQTILDALKKPVTTTATTSTTSTTTTTTTSTVTAPQQPQRVLEAESQLKLASLLKGMKSMDVEERRKALQEIEPIYHSVGLNGKVDIINAMWNMFDFKGVIQEFDVVTYEIPNPSFPEIAEELHELNVDKVTEMFNIARDTLALIKKWIGDKKFSDDNEIEAVIYVCADYLSSLDNIRSEIENRKFYWKMGQGDQIMKECQNIAVSFVNVFAQEFIKTYKNIESLGVDVEEFVKALATFRNNNTSNHVLVDQVEAILDVISEEVNIKINALLNEMQSSDATVRENSLYFSSLYREAASYKNQSRLLQGLMTMVLKERDTTNLANAGLLLEQLPLNNKDQYQILVDGCVNYLQDKDYAKLNIAEKQLIKFMNLSLLKYQKYAKQVKVDEWTKVLSKLEKEIENGENFKKWEIMTAGKKISQTKYGQYIPDETGKMTIEVDSSYLEEKQFKTEIANMRNAATV